MLSVKKILYQAKFQKRSTQDSMLKQIALSLIRDRLTFSRGPTELISLSLIFVSVFLSTQISSLLVT